MNLRGVMLICKSSIGHMLDQESGGSIVMVSSVTARDGGSPNASYLTSKNGLNAYTGRYYSARSIRCNCICPAVLEQSLTRYKSRPEQSRCAAGGIYFARPPRNAQ